MRVNAAEMIIWGVAMATTAVIAIGKQQATVSENAHPATGQIGAHYFDSLGESQIWINIEPGGTHSGPSPVILNFTVAFKGRKLPPKPATLAIRAQARCFPMVAPQVVREPVLRLHADAVIFDLTASGSFQYVANCDQINDTVLVRAPFDTISRLAAARLVTVNALGFDLRLSATDLAALREFVATVQDGVVVGQ